MNIRNELKDTVLTYKAVCCGAEVRKQGRWFMAVPRFRCPSCKQTITLGYETRLKVFSEAERRLKAGEKP